MEDEAEISRSQGKIKARLQVAAIVVIASFCGVPGYSGDLFELLSTGSGFILSHGRYQSAEKYAHGAVGGRVSATGRHQGFSVGKERQADANGGRGIVIPESGEAHGVMGSEQAPAQGLSRGPGWCGGLQDGIHLIEGFDAKVPVVGGRMLGERVMGFDRAFALLWLAGTARGQFDNALQVGDGFLDA